ncbi:type I restriction enzyme M protein [Acidocella aminolytica 101 = DSM 11237]|uniref:site-specific DNA-methyltransferase (adenine-specific) n=2 Tax=Acidocella TaxID=50709 RepID=A0A0D6PAU7_9PROT|nr:class I SAM-dependent DNA methyltransferase [Acidocella aminolytica]GAN78777.1 type I DNA methyltransferase M subunit [Acidocella aminolytica 101 = DSM 11237]GBQ36211.1 type I DNA methyltransferase M subunit HsdM [Acidocella aminolytica 101 = DSM 11237]SHE79805.1 type I restriction enzyme M protein [Acidocella aminolytica 101 = DSM 11237]
MTRQALRDKFIVVLTELGGSAGNSRLRDSLGWAEATYDAVKGELIDDGVVIPGRGRGGSVSLAGVEKMEAVQEEPPAPVRASAAPSRANGNGKGGELGFEGELFKTADKLRGNMEPSDYKHVALGLIFLKHISDSFEAKHSALLAEPGADPEDRDEYAADNVFWVPPTARWTHLQANAKQPSIGKMIDEAMIAIEKDNENLKGVLPKDYARPALNAVMLGELIDLISGIALGAERGEARDVLGRVYEYFLGQFAGSEGKRGGEFYTPRSVVRTMVEMIEPFKGRVYDPCCGSGGMFVQSERFVEEHGGRMGDIAIYGQESNYTTWRLCKMNLAVRGIDADIKWNSDGSFHKDELRDLKADFVLANPPFNISDWGGDRLREDVRWKYGAPPAGNANFAWVQHIVHHLAPAGVAGVVLANGSMSSTQNGEDAIRRALIEGMGGAPGVVDCMVALPGQLFYSTQIPVCLWFLARDRSNGLVKSDKLLDRRSEILFIDARKLGHMVDRTRKEFSDGDIEKITRAYHAWRGEGEAGAYEDVPGFCKAASLEEIRAHNYVLTPGRYVGAADVEEDDMPFAERLAALQTNLEEQFETSDRLNATIRQQLSRVTVDG